MPQHDISRFGKGAVKRPGDVPHQGDVAGAQAPFNWAGIKEDTIGNVSGIFGVTDQDQGSSSTCTCQATRYGFKKALGVDLSIEDIYPHIFLPGGGAYLNAPLDHATANGVAPQVLYPDPSPETEANMEKAIVVQDGDRIRAFTLKYTLYADQSNIDSFAWAVTNHDVAIIGIDIINSQWTDPVDPTFDSSAPGELEGHALMGCKESLVLRNGVRAAKMRSSWCANQIYCHFLNQNYFANGGVFEIIGVDLKEIESMQLIDDNGTFFLVGTVGGKQVKAGIANVDFLNAMLAITDQFSKQSTAGIPQVKVIKDAPAPGTFEISES